MKDSNFVLVQVKGKKTLLLSTVVHNMKYIVVVGLLLIFHLTSYLPSHRIALEL